MSTHLRSTCTSTKRLSDILQPQANTFGLLRLLAALSVVVSHCVHLAGAPESAEPLASLTGYSLGMHAVHVFFTISGVLIAASLARSQTLAAYFRARALRLLPGLAVCVLLTALIAGPLLTELPRAQYFLSGDLWRYIGVTLGLVTANAPLPGVFTHNPVPDIVNLPLWTLKYEAMCYAGLALLGLFGLIGSARKTTVALVPLLLAWLLVCALPGHEPGPALLSFLRLSFSFGLGTLAYVWRDRLPLHWWGVAAAFFAVAVLIGTRLEGPAEQLFVAYAVLWLASLSAGWAGEATRKNDLSYGVYIYDWVIAQGIVRLFPGISQPVLLASTLLVLLPVAMLSWFLIEKPALGWKRRAAQPLGTAGRLRFALRAPLAVGDRPAKPTSDAAPVPVFPLSGPSRDRFNRIATAAGKAVTSAVPAASQEIPAGL